MVTRACHGPGDDTGSKIPASDGPVLALKGDLLATRFEVEDNGDLVEAVEVNAHRLRVALEGSRSVEAGAGATPAPSVELALRFEMRW